MVSKIRYLAIASIIALSTASGALAQERGGIVIPQQPGSVGGPVGPLWAGGVYIGPTSWPSGERLMTRQGSLFGAFLIDDGKPDPKFTGEMMPRQGSLFGEGFLIDTVLGEQFRYTPGTIDSYSHTRHQWAGR